jgi:hypothetical protein
LVVGEESSLPSMTFSQLAIDVSFLAWHICMQWRDKRIAGSISQVVVTAMQ